MSEFLEVHPQSPQPRLIRQAADVVRGGGVIVYPTDSCYALGCAVGNKAGLDRVCRIRDINPRHRFTLICRDLSESATYARFGTPVYRLLKAHTPGPYAFVLQGTKEVPRRMLHDKQKTVGLRVPDHAVAHALLVELDAPMMTSSLILPEEDDPISDPDEIRHLLGHKVDLILSIGFCAFAPTTVVDLTDEHAPRVIRVGQGDPTPFH